MRIDNSAFVAYKFCPLKYYELYEAPNHELRNSGQPEELLERSFREHGIELAEPKPDRDFGTRFHQLLHIERAQLLRATTGGDAATPEYPPWPDDSIESECQSVLAAYLAHYPVEPYEFLEAERTHVIPIPGTGPELVVKIDGVVRFSDGTIGPFDTKTERPGSERNFPESWAARSQASFYLWAVQQTFPAEHVSRLVVDVVTRGNARRSPTFRRMDDICRTQAQLDESIRNLVQVADEIEHWRKVGWWPRNDNNCKDGWRKCDFYPLHIYGRSESTLKLYRPAEAYLDL